MSFNSFGKIFRFTSFGESHGKVVGVVVDGCPAGLRISEKDVQRELDRRKPGQSIVTTQRSEKDKAIIVSGVFDGKTTGAPIAVLIFNEDVKSSDYEELKRVYRPGHADFVYDKKFGFRDYRGGGRSSARETVARVVAGAIAKKYLKSKGIEIFGFTRQIGDIIAKETDFSVVEKNLVRAPDLRAAKKMISLVNKVKSEGDSIGGIVEVVVKGVPVGLGEPVYFKLDSRLAEALMSINAVKGVEIGAGFGVAKMLGSENNDEMFVLNDKVFFKSNNAGGIIGGISTGQDIVVRIAVKPASSILKKQKSVNKDLKPISVEVKGRHDPCLCPRAVPVAEAMVAVVLMDLYLIARTRKK